MRYFNLRDGIPLSEEVKRMGIDILGEVPYPLSEERFDFAEKCLPFYERYYPEIVEEMLDFAKDIRIREDTVFAIFLSMYALVPSVKCSSVTLRDEENVFLGRNSDFFTSMREYNGHFEFDGFHGNSTSLFELEDGRNDKGLAIAFTSVFPHNPSPGFTSGLLLRFLLEKAEDVDGALSLLSSIPIASSQTYVLADKKGTIALVECSSEHMESVRYDEGRHFLTSTNRFKLEGMEPYSIAVDDDWNAARRERDMENLLSSVNGEWTIDDLIRTLRIAARYDDLSGHDTVWSIMEIMRNEESYLSDGNPNISPYFLL